MSNDHPFFYAKVNLEELKKISSNGEIKCRPIDPPYETEFSLPIPKQKFYVDIPISTPHLITDNVIYDLNLNPKYIFCYGSILSIGTLCEFEENDGLWCLITHCSECYREFFGYSRINNNNQEKLKIIRCSTPNCANNLLFRQRLKDTKQYIGK